MADSDQRYTPAYVLDLVRQVAPIGLDPCTIATNPVGAVNFFTEEQDGKRFRWADYCQPSQLVFVNPPYSRGSLKLWMAACATNSRDCNIITLTPTDIGTKWGAILHSNANVLGFWKGRISFELPSGAYDTGAKQPSLLTCWSPSLTDRFLNVFGDYCRMSLPT